jgi:hypothetical protein
MNKDLKLAARFAGHVFIYGAAVAYLQGVTEWPALINAGVAALAAVVIRAGNPADLTFGLKRG